jgi:hypothetical protein
MVLRQALDIFDGIRRIDGIVIPLIPEIPTSEHAYHRYHNQHQRKSDMVPPGDGLLIVHFNHNNLRINGINTNPTVNCPPNFLQRNPSANAAAMIISTMTQ